MNRVRWKLIALVIWMLAAGICYSCQKNSVEGGWEESVENQEQTQVEFTETVGEIYYVHISGQIARPGVYEMKPGDRIFHVIDAAGGFTEEAMTDYLNLAENVRDGMKLRVPDLTETQGENPVEGQPPGEKKININTATREQLMNLRGIGEARAMDVIRYREENGAFQSIEDIMQVSGIKDAAFQKIKDSITVDEY